MFKPQHANGVFHFSIKSQNFTACDFTRQSRISLNTGHRPCVRFLLRSSLFSFCSAIRALSEGKHLKLSLKDDKYIIDAIGFNIGDLASKYLIDDKVDVIGSLDINSFNGNESVQIIIKDIRKSY